MTRRPYNISSDKKLDGSLSRSMNQRTNRSSDISMSRTSANHCSKITANHSIVSRRKNIERLFTNDKKNSEFVNIRSNLITSKGKEKTLTERKTADSRSGNPKKRSLKMIFQAEKVPMANSMNLNLFRDPRIFTDRNKEESIIKGWKKYPSKAPIVLDVHSFKAH